MNYDPNIPAIPTTYNGIEMRSRLEARWAAFFDAVGLPWEYEPIMLGDWWPDFRLVVPCPTKSCANETHTILVEVKPFVEPGEFEQHASKRYLFGEGIEEDGVGHFGRNCRYAWIHLKHSNGKASRLFRTMLGPLCFPGESYYCSSTLLRWLDSKWEEACSVIRQIAAEGGSEPIVQDAVVDNHPVVGPMVFVTTLLSRMNSYMNCSDVNDSHRRKYNYAALLALLDLDNDLGSHLSDQERIISLDWIHALRNSLNAAT